MKTNIFLLAVIILCASLQGCVTGSKLKCPDLASKKNHPVFMARAKRVEHKKQHEEQAELASAQNPTSIPDNVINTEKLFKIKLPAFAAKRMHEQDINDVNVFFKSQAQNGITMVKTENNKVYLEAKSPLAFVKIAESLAFKHPASAAAPGGGGGMAIASGVLGIVGFLLALGPFIGFIAFACGLLAIILGAISLGSARRGWAITGIVLGVITLALAALFLRYFYLRFL